MSVARNQVEEVSKVYDAIWARESHPELSAEKEKLKRIFLDRGISLSGKKVLDCGSGSGMTSFAFASLGAGEVLGIDYSAEAVNLAATQARKRGLSHLSFRRHNLLEPLAMDGEFDIVYAFAVLHHTGDTRRAFHHVARCCGKGGVLSVALYLKTWLAPVWKVVCLSYRRSPTPVRRAFNRTVAGIVRLHDHFLLRNKRVIIDHPIEQQVEEWFGLPIRSHHSYAEVEAWFAEEGFHPELIFPQVARFKSTTNFVMNGIRL
jgi:ubiquinone/menaquinone biosynthesis C-methylase UbiE